MIHHVMMRGMRDIREPALHYSKAFDLELHEKAHGLTCSIGYYAKKLTQITSHIEMRPSFALVVLSSLLSVQALTSQEFSEGIAKIDGAFAQSGPSLDLLNQYDSLLSGSKHFRADSALLSKAYHKKGIIGLSLGKETRALEDFVKALELNPQNLSVKKTLFALFVKYGDKERFEYIAKRYKSDDPDVLATSAQFEEVAALVKNDDLESITKAINISPSDSSLRVKRIDKTIQIIKTSTPNEMSVQFSNLVDDYSKLVKNTTSFTSLTSNYKKLSDIYLFGLVEFTGSLNSNKKCLHYDLDDSDCKMSSKILNKYNKILTSLATFNKLFESWEKADEEEIVFEEIEIKEVAKLLTDLELFFKIRRVNDDGRYKTNLDFLKSLTIGFNLEFNLPASQLELTMLKTLIIDAFLKKDSKHFKSYSQQLLRVDPSQKERFLPYILTNLDHAFNQKDYQKVQELLQSCTKNQKKTAFYQERSEKFERFQRQQQQQQQQQQHEHKQRQHQQYNQQHQQRQRSEPKNDYYKVLEVPKDADLSQIKRAYREKTKQFHPDKYKGDLSQQEIEHKMTTINHAYEVLSNEDTRRAYDQSGEDPNDPETQRGGGQPGNPFGGGRPGGFNFHGSPFGAAGGNFQFNGGSFKFGGMKGRKKRRH